MSEPDKVKFNCGHCGGAISIPADLPATTAPCPLCGQPTTSPEPPTNTGRETEPNVAVEPEENRANEKTNVPAPPDSAPESSPTTVEPTRETDVQTAAEAERETSEDAGKKSSLGKILLVLALLVLLALVGIALMLCQSDRLAPPAFGKGNQTAGKVAVREKVFLQKGWKKEASATLKGFLAAETAEEMLPYVIGGKNKLDVMRAYYENPKHGHDGLTEAQFRHFPLPAKDRERGIFMMNLQRPTQWGMKDFFRPLATREVRQDPSSASFNVRMGSVKSNFMMEDEVIVAFFKKDAGGLRLDWDTFVQSKDSLLEKFLSFPDSGAREVFRGIIIEDIPQGVRGAVVNTRVYRFADMAHPATSARVAVPNNSQAGRFLSEIAWRGKEKAAEARNVTLELKWGLEAEPVLQISRVLCWEFLGVGWKLQNAEGGE